MASSNYVSPDHALKVDSETDMGSPDGEIFFGPMSEKETKIARRLMKRRTELYCPRYALRPSLLEFRKAYNYLPIVEGVPSTDGRKSFSSLEDSLEDEQLASHDGYSDCDDFTSEDDSTVDADGLSVFMEEHTAQGNRNVLSMMTARTIENANDSLEIHSRRSSSFKLNGRKSNVQQETGDVDEIVPETSFEQDSGTGSFIHNSPRYSLQSVALDEQLELMDLKSHPGLASACNIDCNLILEKNDEMKACTLNSTDILPERASFGSDIILPAPPGTPEISYDSISSEECELSKAPEQSPAVERGKLPQASSGVMEGLFENHNFILEEQMKKINLNTSESISDQWENKYVSLTFKPNSENFVSVLNFKKLMASPLPLPHSGANLPDLAANESTEDCDKMKEGIDDPMHKSQISESFDLGVDTAELQAPEEGCLSLQEIQDFSVNTSPEPSTARKCLSPATLQIGDGLESAGKYGIETDITGKDMELERFLSTGTEINDNQQCLTERPSQIIHAEEKEQFLHRLDAFSLPQINNSETTNITNDAKIRCDIQNDPIDVAAKEQACQTSFLGYSVQESTSSSFAKTPDLKSDSAQKTRRIPVRVATTITLNDKPVFKTPSKLPVKSGSAASSATKLPHQQQVKSAANQYTTANRLTPRPGSRFQHVVSPIAKYINDSPLPSLIASNRPLLSRKCKGREPHKIPIAKSTTISPHAPVSSVTKQNRTTRNKSNDELPVVKAKNKLNFASTSKEGNKENRSIEDSIIQELGISCDELQQLDNQKLKNEVIKFIKEKKALIEWNQDIQNNTAVYDSGSSDAALPYMNYTGASSLAMKEVDIVTKLHTSHNKKAILCSPCQPKILKHTGERKVLHWASDIVANPNKLSSPGRPKATAPVIYKQAAIKNSADFCDGNRSTIDVSIVEVVIPKRTNTLSKQ